MSEPTPTHRPTRLTHRDFRLLSCLSDTGGWTSGEIARHLGYTNIRKHSQLIRLDFIRMEALGWVARLDGRSPVAWLRTTAGTDAINV